MPKEIRTKLFISYPNHKLHFSFRPFPFQDNYSDYVIAMSKRGYRQTPIVSLRMLNLLKFLYRSGFRLARNGLVVKDGLQQQVLTCGPKDDFSRWLKRFRKWDAGTRTYLCSAKLTRPGQPKTVCVLNNGVVNMTANLYPRLPNQLAEFLQKHER